MTEMMPKKIPAVVTRHSRDLIQTIREVQERAPDAIEVWKDGKWYVTTSLGVISGPVDTQWEAWQLALEKTDG